MTLDTIGAVCIGATIAVFLIATLGAHPGTGLHRAFLAAGSGAWVGLIAALTARGYLINLPIFGAVCAVSLIFAPFVWRKVSTKTIVGLNVMRALGIVFLLLASAGRLGGPFPYFAGIGDITTGVVALLIALRMRGDEHSDLPLLAWNAFGLVDLIVAVGLGLTSANGSVLQIIHSGAGSSTITTLPWSFIPVLLVPLYVAGHIAIFARAASLRRFAAA